MKKILIREEVCMGCRLCEVFCKLEHSKSHDLIKALKEIPAPIPRLNVEVSKPVSFSLRCQHCSEPICVYSCLTGALHKEDDGTVTVDENKCTGCWTCILVCPYGAIKQDKERHKMVKCDMCGGKELPACVANCPNDALVVVDIEENVPTPELARVK
jgi:anaerobic carbon-monoxide dehydrogenase iron sulfur subunit